MLFNSRKGQRLKLSYSLHYNGRNVGTSGGTTDLRVHRSMTTLGGESGDHRRQTISSESDITTFYRGATRNLPHQRG